MACPPGEGQVVWRATYAQCCCPARAGTASLKKSLCGELQMIIFGQVTAQVGRVIG